MVEPAPELQSKLAAKEDWPRSLILIDKPDSDPYVNNDIDLKPGELNALIKAFDDQEETKAIGITLEGRPYQVTRFYTPMIYARCNENEHTYGLGMIRYKPHQASGEEEYQFLIGLYEAPILSCNAIPQMVDFCELNLGNPE